MRRWKTAGAQREQAEAVIDLRERLAPYVDAADDDPDSSFAVETAPVVAREPAHARAPYRPRHLAT